LSKHFFLRCRLLQQPIVFWVCMVMLLLTACQTTSQQKRKKDEQSKTKQIVLVPMELAEAGALNYLTQLLKDSFGLPVKLKPAVGLPANSWYAPRQRYIADSLLDFLKQQVAVGEYPIGITSKDIAVFKTGVGNFGVMGYGWQPGNACVIASFRLKKGLRNQQHLLERLGKVALHELGHNFGLPHCPNQFCFMVDAAGKNKLDGELRFCMDCKAHLLSFLGE
jgi:archaemetzincin